jgi:hypothetical protein
MLANGHEQKLGQKSVELVVHHGFEHSMLIFSSEFALIRVIRGRLPE